MGKGLERNKGCRGFAKALLYIFVGFIGLLIIGTIVSDPSTKTPATSREEVAAILEEAKPKTSEITYIQDSPEYNQKTVEVAWVAHDYEILKNEDISSMIRIRRKIYIISPTATTKEERIATLMDSVKEVYRESMPDFIAAYLVHRPLNYPISDYPILAMLDYAHDGCGISGSKRDCTGKRWTNARSTDFNFTQEDDNFIVAYYKHRHEFMKPDGFGGHLTDMEGLRGFLKEKFNLTTKETLAMEFRVFAFGQDKVRIPSYRNTPISLTNPRKAKENRCRSDIICWGKKHARTAETLCKGLIEMRAEYAFDWTNSWGESIFNNYGWQDEKAGTVLYVGDKVRFQNCYGAYQKIGYQCTYVPANKSMSLKLLRYHEDVKCN